MPNLPSHPQLMKKNIIGISIIGFLAGLAPDLDVLIRSSTDPLRGYSEYHIRQFFSSLAVFLFPLAPQ